MKKILAISAIIGVLALPLINKKKHIIYAQTLPYNLILSWDAPTDTPTGWNCYLDGTLVTSVTIPTTLTCNFPVNVAGPHIVAVTEVNTNSIPSESSMADTCSGVLKQVPTGCSFVLQAPNSGKNIKAK